MTSMFHEQIPDQNFNTDIPNSQRSTLTMGPRTTKFSLAPWEHSELNLAATPNENRHNDSSKKSPGARNIPSTPVIRSLSNSRSISSLSDMEGTHYDSNDHRFVSNHNSPQLDKVHTPGSFKWELCQAEVIPVRAEIVSNVCKPAILKTNSVSANPAKKNSNEELPTFLGVPTQVKGKKSLNFLRLFKNNTTSASSNNTTSGNSQNPFLTSTKRKTSLPTESLERTSGDVELRAQKSCLTVDDTVIKTLNRKVSFAMTKSELEAVNFPLFNKEDSQSTLETTMNLKFPEPPTCPFNHLPLSPPTSVDSLPLSIPSVRSPPALHLRPVSIGLKMDQYLPPSPDSSCPTVLSLESPISSASSMASSISMEPENGITVQQLMTQFNNARKAWQLKMWDMEAEVRDMKLQLANLALEQQTRL